MDIEISSNYLLKAMYIAPEVRQASCLEYNQLCLKSRTEANWWVNLKSHFKIPYSLRMSDRGEHCITDSSVLKKVEIASKVWGSCWWVGTLEKPLPDCKITLDYYDYTQIKRIHDYYAAIQKERSAQVTN